MAELLELKGETGFRVRAYDRGARALSGHRAALTKLSERERAATPGVGKAIAAKVREYLDTGRVAKLEALRAEVPPGLRALVRVPGLGPAKARLVHEGLGVSSPEELAEALAAGRVAGLPGMGARTEANLRRALERMAPRGDGIPLAPAPRPGAGARARRRPPPAPAPAPGRPPPRPAGHRPRGRAGRGRRVAAAH